MKTNKFTYALVLGLAAAISFSACGKKNDDTNRTPAVGAITLGGVSVSTLNGESIRVSVRDFKLPAILNGTPQVPGYPNYGNTGQYIRTYSNTGSAIFAPTVANNCYGSYGASCQIAYAEVLGTTSSSQNGYNSNQRFEATIDYMILNTSNGVNTDVAYLVTVQDFNNQTEVKQIGILVRFANSAATSATIGTNLAVREQNMPLINKMGVQEMGNLLLQQAP